MRQVVVAGSTGLVGREVVRLLASRPDVAITALVRRLEGKIAASDRVKEVLFDYTTPASYDRLGGELACDTLLCCLGTTLKKAGSPAAFLEVDREYPLALLRRLATRSNRPVFGLCSSVGANRPRGLYLEAKAAVEEAVRASGLPAVIVRPSLLLGERAERRVAERVAIALAVPPFRFLGRVVGRRAGWVGMLAPVPAADVARSLVDGALRLTAGAAASSTVLEGWDLRPSAAASFT
jgi:uncharacterized protein YbjT (DUF2867 family)